MTSIVNVSFLVQSNDPSSVLAALHALLLSVTEAPGGGTVANSVIQDFSIGHVVPTVQTNVANALAAGVYKPGDAFAQGFDHYLLQMEGDVTPILHGPYPSDAIVLEQGRSYRNNSNRDDGLYRLMVTSCASLEINPFVNGELDSKPELDPLVDFVITELQCGRTPIERFGTDIGFFTILYQGDEVVLTFELLCQIECELGRPLRLIHVLTVDKLVTPSMAGSHFTTALWRTEVSKSLTEEGYEDWLQTKVEQLPISRSVVIDTGK